MFCTHCGKEIDDKAVVCIHCGCPTANKNKEERGFTEAYLLCWFLGSLGIHRFYTGHTITGVIQLLTMGGCGIWSMIDFVTMSFNKFKDIDGNELKDYNKTLGMIGFGVWIVGISIMLLVLLIMVIAIASSASS